MVETEITKDSMSGDLADAILPVTILFGILAGIGIAGNALVLFFYKFKYPDCNFRYFVICLAGLDFCSCLIVIPMEIYMQRHWFNFPISSTWLCILKKLVSGFLVCVSACLLLLISIDRYLKVCRPLTRQLQPRRALHLCLAILIGFSLLYLPAFSVFGQQSSNITYKGQTLVVHTCQRSDKTKNEAWTNIYIIIVYYIPTILSTVASTVAYVLVVRSLFRRLRVNVPGHRTSRVPVETSEEDTTGTTAIPPSQNESTNRADDTQNNRSRHYPPLRAPTDVDPRARIVNKTVIMLILTVVFDITMIVYFITYSLIVNKGHIFNLATKDSVGIIFFLWRLYFFNHIVNPFVYGFLDSRFRTYVKDVFERSACWCLCRR